MASTSSKDTAGRDSRIVGNGSASAKSTPESTLLIGRDDEVTLLNTALNDALAGRSRTVAITGEPGIGKTFLASFLLLEAEKRGALVAATTCTEMAGAPPLWPWREVLARLPDSESILELLDDSSRASESGQSNEENDAIRFTLFSRVLESIRRAASDAPLLISFDDMHWADTASQELFTFVASHIGADRVMLVSCLRTSVAEQSERTRALLAAAGRQNNSFRIEPEVLGTDEIRVLVESVVKHSITRKVADEIAEKTRGVPLFVRELARSVDERGQHLQDNVPGTITELLESRIDQLDDDARTVLNVAAVLGRAFTPKLTLDIIERSGVDYTSGLSNEAILNSIEKASVAGIFQGSRLRAGEFEFSHPLFTEVARERIPAGNRAKLHATTAALLEEQAGHRANENAAQLAWHFEQAMSLLGSEKMVHYSLIAGQNALRSFAWAEALGHFENVRSAAEEESDSIELAHAWLGIARARMTYESRWGSNLTAQDIYDGLKKAFEIFLTHGETNLAVDAASQGIVGTPGWLPSPELTERALEFANEDSVATARLLTRHADTIRRDRSRIRESVDAFDRGLEMARAHNDASTQLRNLRIQAQYLLTEHQYESVLARRDAGLKVVPTEAAKLDLALLHMRAAEAEASLGMVSEGERSLDLGRQLCESIGVEATVYHLVRALFHCTQGRFEEAVREANEVERLDTVPASDVFEFLRDAYTGDFRAMSTVAVDRYRELPIGPETNSHRVFYLMMMGWIGRELGDRALIEQAEVFAEIEFAKPPGDYLEAGLRTRLRHILARTSGDIDSASREYDFLLSQSGTFNFHEGGPVNDLLLAQLALAMSDRDLARDHFEKSLEFSHRAGLPVGECETIIEYARLLLENRVRVDTARAVELLVRGVELASKCGLKYLGESMGQMLETATIGRPVHPAGLTAREVDVVRLLVGGRSNPQIAEELFISLNTVLRHVSNIFGKLNVSSRTEAAIKAVEIGAVEKS